MTDRYNEPDDMGTCVQCNHWAPLGKGTLCETCTMEASLPNNEEDYDDQG